MIPNIEPGEPKPRKKKPVTLIVGIVCRDAVILAAESETTRGNAKYQGTHKLHIIPFKSGHRAIIGEAGSAFPAGVCADAVERIASITDVDNEYAIPKAVEAAFREMVKGGHGPKMGSRKCQEFHGQEDNYFQFLIGYYFNGKPHLYEFSSYYASARKCPRPFAVVGIGGDLAEYLLRPFAVAEMPAKQAMFTAVYVVGEVKNSVAGCGGPTQLAILSPHNACARLSPESIKDLESRAGYLKQKREAAHVEMRSNIAEATISYVAPFSTDEQINLEG
jgi:20S proteasome alpha/beta subunit